MGLFGSKNEKHTTPCEPGGFGWPKNPKNPMGWGNDKPRVVRETRPKMHGSRAERRLMGGTGGLIKQDGSRVKVTGERPKKRGKR